MLKILRPFIANSAGSTRAKIRLAVYDQEIFFHKVLDLIELVKLQPQHEDLESFDVFSIEVQPHEITRLGLCLISTVAIKVHITNTKTYTQGLFQLFQKIQRFLKSD